MYSAIQRCSQVYLNMVGDTNLIKEPLLLCGGRKANPSISL